jgi:anti-sigma regulatory factor (Ser/Thr protein kinase)
MLIKNAFYVDRTNIAFYVCTMPRKRPDTAIIRDFILNHVADHPADIISFTADTFAITRQAVHRHVRALITAGALKVTGDRAAARYRLPARRWNVQLDLRLHREEDVIFDRNVDPHLQQLPQNVHRICYHGFTEMCNNAIDHSGGKRLRITIERTPLSVVLAVQDDGIGIFAKIQHALGLPDARSSILELSKGKFTTDPQRHSGQGIFFTSRMFDQFSIRSGSLLFTHNVTQDDEDWLLQTHPPQRGTRVEMRIATASTRTAKEVFDRFSSTDGDYAFSKTHVPLRLAQHENGILISRSQAKRVLARFDRFEEIYLDFKGVDSIGQSFADEIFRVFRLHNPAIKLVWTNASPEVENMIQRALKNAPPAASGQLELFP